MTKKPRATATSDQAEGLASASDVKAIVAGTHGNPFAVLGVQQTGEWLGKTGILGAQESDTAGAGDRLHKLLKFDGHKRSDRLEDRFPRDSRAG